MDKKPRSYKIFDRIIGGGGEGILDIPHPVVLQCKTPDLLIAEFERVWGVRPNGIVLPVVAPDGLLYECEGLALPYSRAVQSFATSFDFAETIKRFSQLVPNIYLLLDPTFGFVRTDALHLVDIVGDGSAQVCIGNPRSRELLAAVLGIGIDIALAVLEKNDGCKLAGVILDACDIWPQGATNERLELTCFCESCSKFFDNEDPQLLRKFRTFPNPWNLVLRDTGTGVNYISDIPMNIDSSAVIGLSRQRGFAEVFKDASEATLNQLARDLLRYIEVRHIQTVQSMHDIFDQAFDGLEEYSLKRVVLCEGASYDWTSGLQLDRLDSRPEKPGDPRPFDEIWFNPSSSDTFTTCVDFRSYMWRRGRYFIDAFFETAAVAADPVKRATTGVARLSERQIRDMLGKRLRTATSTADMELTSLAALPKLKGSDSSGSRRIGFVGVALTEEIGEKFIKDIDIPKSGAEKQEMSSDDQLLQFQEMLRQLQSRQGTE